MTDNHTYDSSAPPVKSAHRVLELLEFFADWRRPATVKEVCQELGYPQSSASVLLKSLKDLGYFDHDPRTGMYCPNVRLALATAWIQEQLYSEQNLLRMMERLLEKTGHTIMIGTQHGVHLRYLHVLQSTRVGGFPALNNAARSGSLRPLFLTASGKMLLTTLAEREIAKLLLKANSQESDPRRHVTLQDALAERQKASRLGYAVSLGTAGPAAAAIATLLPVPIGREPLTLSIGGPLKDVKNELPKLAKILEQVVQPFKRSVEGSRLRSI